MEEWHALEEFSGPLYCNACAHCILQSMLSALLSILRESEPERLSMKATAWISRHLACMP